jgi:uncharacterized protein YijF (DUF1287 family)
VDAMTDTSRSILLLTAIAVVLSTRLAAQEDFVNRLIAAAIERTRHQVTYDGAYRRLSYPGGDVPDSIGVCTDLVIRSYRAVGIDLQKQVHEDISKAFSSYPKVWGLRRPDSNIDHRRVLNLQTFLRRNGESLGVSSAADDYKPGDLVTWILPGNLPHIGIVTDHRSQDGARPLIVHNIGRGPEVEDMLFDYPITGHYRYIMSDYEG